MLKQRAKLRWMKHGDQNSKVFFRKINSARAKQRIFQIMKATGEVLTGTQDVTQEFISYFQSLLGGTSPHRVVDLDFLRSDLKHTLTIDEANLLDAPVTQSDIKDAFFAIDEDSAPATFSVALNGSVHGFFKGSRGLRQDLPSIQVLRDTLTEFAALSGLNVNPAKSQIILSRAVQQERRQIVEYLGFQEGSLPVRYLGVPLTSSRLTIADCRPLINRIDTQLAGWNQHNLSYAGRVQLIKGNAKVAWDQICKPKEEGGLGIRSMLAMNQALMLKHLWRILQNDEHRSGWTGFSITDFVIPQFGHSMCYRILELEEIDKITASVANGVCYKVGNGSSFSLWQDIWHARGPLCLLPERTSVNGLTNKLTSLQRVTARSVALAASTRLILLK
ncbi:UNVERIFIED_CONTAM: hypothetical protein Scaly_3137900 [Sesamum calycinum]|uniref:Reverse transcriptase domain-containing protein n=1 Tax=Sesamum calycinum TaxID=2727403 RepID=A0AAW2JHA7_9LAMI